MSHYLILVILFFISLILGFIKYGSLANEYKASSWQLKFIEFWNDFTNFFITALIGFYFVTVRLPILSKTGDLVTADFALFIMFILGIFGHLCVMSKNITEGVNAILKKILER